MATMMTERATTGMPATMPGVGMPVSGMAGTMPANWMMVPRCTFEFEPCPGGMKIWCRCEDKMAQSMVQNLCSMLAGGMCSCCCMMNGMVVGYCCLTMGLCKCEMTDKGCCITCTSGDETCCAMIRSCCDCLCTMCKCGCTCCLMLNHTPVCCGSC